MDRQPDVFHCAVEPDDDRVLVQPTGELDCFSVGHVEAQLAAARAAGARSIELDLGGLSFLDSTGIALVLRWSQASSEDSFDLRVTNGTGDVRRLFELMAIAHLLDETAAEKVL